MKALTVTLLIIAFTFADVIPIYSQTDQDIGLSQLSKFGIFIGYDDGTQKPDEPITYAQFITVMNRLMGFDRLYSRARLAETSWFAGSIQTAKEAGYFDPDLAFDTPVSQSYVAQILDRFFFILSDSPFRNNFKNFYAKNNIIYSDTTPLTRADFASVLCSALGISDNMSSSAYANLATSTSIVTLSDTTISGNLYVLPTTKNLSLNNVTVNGMLIVLGSPEMHLHNSTISNMLIKSFDRNQPVITQYNTRISQQIALTSYTSMPARLESPAVTTDTFAPETSALTETPTYAPSSSSTPTQNMDTSVIYQTREYITPAPPTPATTPILPALPTATPMPEPETTPAPTPEPETTTTPTPEPETTPAPTPETTPTPTPEPETTPAPTLEPEITPAPTPEPETTPAPTPEPTPTPSPRPEILDTFYKALTGDAGMPVPLNMDTYLSRGSVLLTTLGIDLSWYNSFDLLWTAKDNFTTFENWFKNTQLKTEILSLLEAKGVHQQDDLTAEILVEALTALEGRYPVENISLTSSNFSPEYTPENRYEILFNNPPSPSPIKIVPAENANDHINHLYYYRDFLVVVNGNYSFDANTLGRYYSSAYTLRLIRQELLMRYLDLNINIPNLSADAKAFALYEPTDYLAVTPGPTLDYRKKLRLFYAALNGGTAIPFRSASVRGQIIVSFTPDPNNPMLRIVDKIYQIRYLFHTEPTAPGL